MKLVLKEKVYDGEGDYGYQDYDFTPSSQDLRIALSFILRDLYIKHGGKQARDGFFEFLKDVDMEYIAENYEDDLTEYFQAAKDWEERQ